MLVTYHLKFDLTKKTNPNPIFPYGKYSVPVGFEPTSSGLKVRYPNPLDEETTQAILLDSRARNILRSKSYT